MSSHLASHESSSEKRPCETMPVEVSSTAYWQLSPPWGIHSPNIRTSPSFQGRARFVPCNLGLQVPVHVQDFSPEGSPPILQNPNFRPDASRVMTLESLK